MTRTSCASQNRAPAKATSKRLREGLQKVSAQLEASEPTPQVVNNPLKQLHFTMSRHTSPVAAFSLPRLQHFEIARVLVRFDDVAAPAADAVLFSVTRFHWISVDLG